MSVFSWLHGRGRGQHQRPLPLQAPVVRPDTTPLHVKRGWVEGSKGYAGYYRTRYGAWKGSIQRRGDRFRVYIHNPPTDQLKQHSRWVCFYWKRRGVYEINLSLNPRGKDIDSVIFYVEQILCESFEMER